MKMAPTKQNGTALLSHLRKTITTRSKAPSNANQNTDDQQQQPLQRGKRKADISPLKYDRGVKRSALCNLTNTSSVQSNESDPETGLKVNAKTTNQNGPAASIVAAKLLHNILGNNIKKAAVQAGKAVVTEVFTKPDPDGPKTRAATKILTRAASRKQSGGSEVASAVAKAKSSAAAAAAAGQPSKDRTSTVTTTTTATVKTKPLEGTTNSKQLQVPTAKTAATAAASQQQGKSKRRISNDFEKTEDSLYVSALEDVTGSGSLRLSENFGARTPSDRSSKGAPAKDDSPASPRKRTPEGVEDYDFANWNDVFQVSHYAHDIFTYQKERECQFVVPDYMARQPHISKWMRALLVDWMVEIQESFELNHETLYLAVKIVDIYLSRAEIQKDSLQLLGAAALFIASKYDERVPPTVDDFQYICDGAYQRREMILMEMTVFRAIGYDLGIPLSYRFLRRYARVNRIDMPVLTLARYILEFSLMEYATVQVRDSKLACAALFIAMRMSGMPGWNQTLEYYSGYKIEDFAEVAILLNNIMTRKPKESLNTVRHKYSHELFFESAKKPFINDLTKLFDTTGFQLSSISSRAAANGTTPTPTAATATTTAL